jgi:hypothetical protein
VALEIRVSSGPGAAKADHTRVSTRVTRTHPHTQRVALCTGTGAFPGGAGGNPRRDAHAVESPHATRLSRVQIDLCSVLHAHTKGKAVRRDPTRDGALRRHPRLVSDSEVRFRTSPLRREVSYHGVIIRRSALSHEEVSYHGVIM